MRVLILTKGQHTVVDDDVYEWASKFKWMASESPRTKHTYYAVRRERRPGPSRQRTVILHREIMGAPKGVLVDHEDGDGLNNLRDNLRLCTVGQNTQNQRIRKDKSSQYKGVSWNKRQGVWDARVCSAGRKIFLGLFREELDAARAYDSAALRLHGTFARLNFPTP